MEDPDRLTVVDVPDHPEHRPLLHHPVDLIKRLLRSKPTTTGQKLDAMSLSQRAPQATHQ